MNTTELKIPSQTKRDDEDEKEEICPECGSEMENGMCPECDATDETDDDYPPETEGDEEDWVQ